MYTFSPVPFEVQPTPWFISLSDSEMKKKIRYYQKMIDHPRVSAGYKENASKLVEKMKAELERRAHA